MVRPKGWRVSGRNGEGEGKGWKENEKRKSIGIRTSGREKNDICMDKCLGNRRRERSAMKRHGRRTCRITQSKQIS